MSAPKNIFYAQSGGVTAVINATACGLIETARRYPETFGKIYAGHNGIIGALKEELIDTNLESAANIAALRHTPAGAFGSCRHKLKRLEEDTSEYQRILDVFKAHNIGYFFYNGGGDSQDTANKISKFSQSIGAPIQCIGIPKTIDNDLPLTDNCPGFGSVAKYVNVSVKEAGLDTASMCHSSTKVFILEVMGRHAGWIAASSGLSAESVGEPPHIILFPEVAFDEETFLGKVKFSVENYGYCVIVASEGTRYASGRNISASASVDAFGHKQLGGVAPILAALIKKELGYKYHWAMADYLQRSARHIASKTDVEQAYALGKAAVEFALAGKTAVMPTIVRESDEPYRWSIGEGDLSEAANIEKMMPDDFISDDGFGITEKAKRYFSPLIEGEDFPPFKNGLPVYVKLKNQLAKKILNVDYQLT
jgi:ATP-dependent phosphofructokinase / diphosphate-dependent phosphofructokinase